MVFPLGAWCPSVGKGRKGKEDGHQGNRLYSYSTYVLKSINKRCSTVFLVAGRVQAAAEKAHSRKHVFTRSEHWRRERDCGFLRGGAGTSSQRTREIFPSPAPLLTSPIPTPA